MGADMLFRASQLGAAVSIYSDGTYLAANPEWHAEDSVYKASLVVKILTANSVMPSTIADIGCGAGRVAETLAERFGVPVTGFDISSDAASFWRGKAGVSFICGDYATSNARFHTAVCLDVFEHVEDYFGFLRSIRQRSEYVVFNIPLDMCVLKLVSPALRRAREVSGHLHYFNEYSALATISGAGYSVVDSFIATPIFSTLPRNPYQWLLAAPRMALSLLSKRVAATMLGGHSLVVLARCHEGSTS